VGSYFAVTLHRKIRIITFWIILSITIFLFASHPVDSSKNIDAPEEKSPVTKIDEGIFQIGNLVVDSNIREIYCNGHVNMSEGMIELLACAPGGKVHESVLILDTDPTHLQVALLLLGLEQNSNTEEPDAVYKPGGSPIYIFIEWKDKQTGEIKSFRGEDLVYNIAAKRTMRPTHWVFNGSRIQNGLFMASVEKSLITTYNDPNTIIDNPLDTGSDDTLYEVNEALVPARGTEVKAIIKPRNNERSKTE